MLIEYIINDTGHQVEHDKIAVAIDRLKFGYELSRSRGLGALYICFSGGKDSIVIAHIAKLSGVPYELHYNVTGIDPPEVIYFMRANYPELNWHPPEKTMWQLIEKKKIPPTRKVRYCCSELKERGGIGRVCVTGVRWAESTRRKTTRRQYEIKTRNIKNRAVFNDNDNGRKGIENCVVKGSPIINPIVDWSDAEVWEFIRLYNLPYCELYDQGETRIGCIGCPMSRKKNILNDFERYPRFKNLYLMAFDKMLAARQEAGLINKNQWSSAEEVMHWFIFGKNKKPLPLLELGGME